ncbi:MerR family transcriptional regulator [Gordonia sp. SL306]|uniref:MerR family transcriptional regulator n=1 Tax=Gordonia sp. SL306 TaxID=2995145 RepID=UPI00226DCD3C|nr:MerR family transcriptional regulator [Gordonia sp. SL306]WAC57523.1 MerR family transcriptional regulator [Gordonia sp. SL306]
MAHLATLIEHMSATPRYVGKQSRELETTITRLLANATRQAFGQPAVSRYRIDDLARISGVTTRNIRVYRERGLLPPPHRVGRVTLYSDSHVSRLALISSMLSRGYTIAHIDELITAWQNGGQIADVLGLETELTDIQEPPTSRSTSLTELAEAGVDAADANRLVRLKLITIHSADDVTVEEPALLDTILPLITATRPASAVIDVIEQVTPAFQELGQAMIGAAEALAVPTAGGTGDDRLTEVTLTLVQLRALADAATRVTLTETTNTLLAQSLATRLGEGG